MPTRLPYGVSFVKPGAVTSAYTLKFGATPNVSLGTYFVAHKSANTITNFLGGELGKVIMVTAKSGGVTTIQNSAGGISVFSTVATLSAGILKYSSTGNYLMANNETMFFVHTGTGWSQVCSNIRIE